MLTGESAIQQSIVIWFNNEYCLKFHVPRCVIFSIPNESEDGWEAKKKFNVGLLRGTSDLIVLLPSRVQLFFECKTNIGAQSPAQIDFQSRVESLGFTYYLVRSLSQFQQLIQPHITWQKKS